MRQREGEVLAFRTPQHPSLGTNNWGGASPLLARNVPKESLEQKYTKLNTVRTRDEIFPADAGDDDYDDYVNVTGASANTKKWNKGIGVLFKLVFVRKKKNTVRLGSHLKRRRWLPRLDPKTRWPQGWC